MSSREQYQPHEQNLTPEYRIQRAGEAFGKEYYRRVNDPSAPTSHQYIFGDLPTTQPDLYALFMTGAQNSFQICASNDLIEQGVPQELAEEKAFAIGEAFRTFATALYENNLGVGRLPKSALPESAPQDPRTP